MGNQTKMAGNSKFVKEFQFENNAFDIQDRCAKIIMHKSV